jgi:hypothetical protein
MSAMSSPDRVVGVRQPGLLVYLCGLGTSALVLWLAHLLAEGGTNVMGWYVNAIIPAGAILVGFLSGSGYALGSYFLEIKLSRAFVLGMITTAILDYWAAEYLAYSRLLKSHHASPDAYPFFRYVRDVCENMTFKSSSSASGTELGVGGYFFKLLELTGFTLGMMGPSAFLRAIPYCRRCQRYLKVEHTGYLESEMRRKELDAQPRKERPLALQNAVAQVWQAATQRVTDVPRATLDETRTLVRELNPRHERASTAQVEFKLRKCPACEGHHLRVTLNYLGLDKRPVIKQIAVFDKTQAATETAAA